MRKIESKSVGMPRERKTGKCNNKEFGRRERQRKAKINDGQ